MRGRVLLAVLLLGLAGGPAGAQDSAGAIRKVISEQIAAFRADDFTAAFTFASPAIQRMFGSPDRFGQMVRSGYPMVWRPSAVRFSRLVEEGGRVVQGVLVTDEAGALHVLDYEMVPGAEGWRINGVTLRRPEGAGA